MTNAYRAGCIAIGLSKSADRMRDRGESTYAIISDSECLPRGTWGRVCSEGFSTVIFRAWTPGRRGSRLVQAAQREVTLL